MCPCCRAGQWLVARVGSPSSCVHHVHALVLLHCCTFVLLYCCNLYVCTAVPQVVLDIAQVWHNCHMYNREGSSIRRDAKFCAGQFQKLWQAANIETNMAAAAAALGED